MPKKLKKKKHVMKENIEEEEEKKKNILTLFWTGFLILTMIISLFAFGSMNSNSSKGSIKYGGYKFIYSASDHKYYVNYNSNKMSFFVLPTDINQSFNFTPTQNIDINVYNLTYNEKYLLGQPLADLYQLFAMNLINVNVLKNKTALKCDDLTINFIPSNETLRTYKNCIYVPLNQDLAGAVDFITYKYLGILK